MVAVGSAESQQAALDKTENSDLPMPNQLVDDLEERPASQPSATPGRR
jgi:hypothetical protein